MEDLLCTVLRWGRLLPMVMGVCAALLFPSCSDEEPSALNPCAVLTLEYASANRIAIRIELPVPGNVLLTRADTTLFAGAIDSTRIVIVDSGLAAGKSYRYTCRFEAGGRDCSALLDAHTLDTTRHPFGAVILDTLGGLTSLVVDIAVLSDDDIWVTGFFWPEPPRPEVGLDSIRNMAHWDGTRWTFSSLPNRSTGNDGVFIERTDAREMVVYAIGIHVYRNEVWQKLNVPKGEFPARDVAVTDDRRYHFVGGRGFWSIWNGDLKSPSYQTLKLPENIDFKRCDTDGKRVFAVGEDYSASRYYIYKWDPAGSTGSQPVPVLSASRDWTTDIWCDKSNNVVAVSGKFPRIETPYELFAPFQLPPYPVFEVVKGESPADIYFAGGPVGLMHFNGSNFRRYYDLFTEGPIYALDFSPRFVYLAGNISFPPGLAQAVVIRMNR